MKNWNQMLRAYKGELGRQYAEAGDDWQENLSQGSDSSANEGAGT